MNKIPYTDFGGKGDVLLFVHANGFPPTCYKHLIDYWTPHYHVIGIHQRPLWQNSDYKQLKSWSTLSEDLISFIHQNQLKDVKCVGHSLGGVISANAATVNADIFSHVILLEPVLFTRLIPFLARLFPPSFSKDLIPISKIALKRKDRWASHSDMFSTYRQKKIFEKIDDEVLHQMVQGFLIKSTEEEYSLIYSKNWEAQVYATIMYIQDKIKSSPVPISIAKGEFTDVISDKTWQSMFRHLKENNLKEFKDTTHLLPFEKPSELGNWVLDQLHTT